MVMKEIIESNNFIGIKVTDDRQTHMEYDVRFKPLDGDPMRPVQVLTPLYARLVPTGHLRQGRIRIKEL